MSVTGFSDAALASVARMLQSRSHTTCTYTEAQILDWNRDILIQMCSNMSRRDAIDLGNRMP